MTMQATAEETNVLVQKTRELCQTLVGQPEFSLIRQRIDAFLADETAKSQYELVMQKGDALQHRQDMGQPLDGAEIADFEKNREILLANPLARDFIDAQQLMHKMQESVIQYVSKTFELGRVPNEDDFSAGSCGPTCGCGH